MDQATRDWIESTTGQKPWWPAIVRSPRRARVRLGATVIAESYSPVLVLQYGRPPTLPTYYFTPDEVDQTRLVDSKRQSDGSTMWDVEAGGKQVRAAAWTHPEPTGELATLAGMVTFDWWSDLEWCEEEERVFAHARDPFKRVDVVSSSRHVEVYLDDVKLADSSRPLALFETYLPTRFYLPPEDVRLDLLTPSDTITMCPYKGVSRHWTRSGGEVDIAWAYPEPVPENPRIKDRVCFYNERVDLVIDGQLQERPKSPWQVQ